MARQFLLLSLVILGLYMVSSIILTILLYTGQYSIRQLYIYPNGDVLHDSLQKPEERDIAKISSVLNASSSMQKEKKTLKLDPTLALLDQSRNFLTHPFTVPGEKWAKVTTSWEICMSTQTSTNLLFWISKQAEIWLGPISVSIFTPDVDYTVAAKMIDYLRKCFPSVRERVTFHVTYPRNFPPIFVDDNAMMNYDCDHPELTNKALLRQFHTQYQKDILETSPYPQNLLRNIARKGCPNEYTFTPDVDMISIPGMSEGLNEFVSRDATKSCPKCTFIMPTYEIHLNVTTNPLDKNELKELIRKEEARRFHIKAYTPNQANSQLERWEEGNTTDGMEIMYSISTWRNYWEPIFITRADAPLFDERFIGYGFTRSSQVFEMYMAGYKWYMLNNAFLCHQGFQTVDWNDKNRRSQISKNSIIYTRFKKEIHARYNKAKTKKQNK